MSFTPSCPACTSLDFRLNRLMQHDTNVGICGTITGRLFFSFGTFLYTTSTAAHLIWSRSSGCNGAWAFISFSNWNTKVRHLSFHYYSCPWERALRALRALGPVVRRPCISVQFSSFSPCLYSISLHLSRIDTRAGLASSTFLVCHN